jgi:hypothetical protein
LTPTKHMCLATGMMDNTTDTVLNIPALAARLCLTHQAVRYRLRQMLNLRPRPSLLPRWRIGAVGRFWLEADVATWEQMYGHEYVRRWGNENRSRTLRGPR